MPLNRPRTLSGSGEFPVIDTTACYTVVPYRTPTQLRAYVASYPGLTWNIHHWSGDFVFVKW